MVETRTTPEQEDTGRAPGAGTDPRVVVGLRLAFALASLLVGLTSLINVLGLDLLGLETAVLAVAFGWMALKGSPAPRLPTRRWWAWVGVGLGAASIALVVIVAVFDQQGLRDALGAGALP